MKTKELREEVMLNVNNMNDEQLSFLLELFNLSRYATKDDVIKLSYDKGEIGTYDTAYPIDYFRKIEDIYPNIKDGMFIFDYTHATFGELVNVNDKFAKKILNFFGDLW